MSVQTLAEIRQQFRDDTGRSQTADISDSDVNDLINDYYVNYFPADAQVDEFDDFFTQALSAIDSVIYSVSQNIDRLDDPVTINGNPIILCRNRELFFSGQGSLGTNLAIPSFQPAQSGILGLGKYEDEQFITPPGLAIGTDATKVLHATFDYEIQQFAYSKDTSEVDLTGDTIPQNKYGAWSLKIDTDGTITVTPADDNATGYDTPRKALEGLGLSDNESAYMGYVTVISTDAFIPGTTALDDGAVTDTYTDGRFEIRNTPTVALLYGQNLYVRPKPNDIFQLKALSIADRPIALDSDDDTVDDAKWGIAIARGAAIRYLEPRGGQGRIADLALTTKHMIDSIRLDKYKRLKNMVQQATF